jgi:hypothetical protein
MIPKPNGKQRPLGIPTVRDRVVQTAVRIVIKPLFEADFQECSYGYRPKRSAVQASLEVYKWLNYGLVHVVDVDLETYFDRIPHERLLQVLQRRIADGYILRLIRAWLRAGILYGHEFHRPTEGTPQGATLSPLLANCYLNELDRWWLAEEMTRRSGWNAQLVRYADGMPEQALDQRVKVPSPQLPVQGSSLEAAYVGDCVGQVPRHRPPKVAAERQAAAKANPQVSLVIRRSGRRPSRLLGKAATLREATGTCTAVGPSGCQGRHVAMVQGPKTGRPGCMPEQSPREPMPIRPEPKWRRCAPRSRRGLQYLRG